MLSVCLQDHFSLQPYNPNEQGQQKLLSVHNVHLLTSEWSQQHRRRSLSSRKQISGLTWRESRLVFECINLVWPPQSYSTKKYKAGHIGMPKEDRLVKANSAFSNCNDGNYPFSVNTSSFVPVELTDGAFRTRGISRHWSGNCLPNIILLHPLWGEE